MANIANTADIHRNTVEDDKPNLEREYSVWFRLYGALKYTRLICKGKVQNSGCLSWRHSFRGDMRELSGRLEILQILTALCVPVHIGV